MHEIVGKLLNSQEGILLLVVSTVIGLNIFLTSLKKFLGWLKGKTESQVDDKAYAFISKILGWSETALEFASANSQALPPKVKAELDKREWDALRDAEVADAIDKAKATAEKIAAGEVKVE